MLKILVTGANGFLAGNIINELLRRGYKIRGMLRKPSEMITEHPNLEAFYGNITGTDDVIKAAEGCSVVIHFAALISQSVPEYCTYEQVNVGGTRNIIKACIEHNARKL